MIALEILLKVFLFPGNTVIQKCGISVEEDGGIFRSFINMCFWGTVSTGLLLHFFG